MIILRNSIKILLCYFFTLESSTCLCSDLERIMEKYDPHYIEYSDHRPDEYAVTLEYWVKKNRYDMAKEVYFGKTNKLRSILDEDLLDENYSKYRKALHQYIFLQRAVYKYADNFIFHTSDQYDPKIIFISTLLDAAYYFSDLNSDYSNNLFKEAKRSFDQALASYDENLKRWKDYKYNPPLFERKIKENEEDRQRVVDKFEEFFRSY